LLDGATLFSIVDSNELRLNVKNKIALICAKFGAHLINTSKVTSRQTKWPRCLAYPVLPITDFAVQQIKANVDFRIYGT